MTYRIDPNPTFWETVKARKPGEDNEVETFRARFKALTTDEFNGYDLADPERTRAFLEETLLDIEDVEAADGSPLKFTVAVRDRLLRVPHVRRALVAAYVRAFRDVLSGN